MTNVLVVSAFSYKKLESMLDTLIEKFPEKQFEFYIVNETYGCNPPTNPKYNNYVSIDNFLKDKENNIVSNYAQKWPKFDFSIQTDEFSVTMLAILNSNLNLSGLTINQEPRFRDKVRMKQFLGHDIRKPKLYNQQDILNNLIDYPVIVKPRTYATSRGVYIVQNKEELLNNIIGKSVSYDRNSIDTIDDIEIEEYIDADTYHIDGLVFNGDIIFCTASRYIGSCLNYAQGEILGSISVPILQQKQALNFAKKVHRDLKIPDGAFHLECFFKNQEFIFLEIGIRSGGSEIVPAIEAATGINLTDEHVKCQLGIEPILSTDVHMCYGWLNFPKIFNDDSPKYVKSITLPTANPVSLYCSKIPQVGEKAIADFIHYGNTLGSFIFLSDNYEQLEKDMHTYRKEYQVELE